VNKNLVFICLIVIGLFCWKEQTKVLAWKDKAVAMVKNLVSPRVKEEGTPSEPENSPPSSGPSVEKKTADAPVPAQPKPGPDLLPTPPPGVYYLTERVKIVTAAGIAAYKAGLEVKEESDKGDSLLVTDGTSSFVVAKSKLTRDMAVVMDLRRSEASATPVAAVAPTTTASKPQTSVAPVNNRAAAQGKSAEMRAQYQRQIDMIDQQIKALVAKMDAASVQVAHAQSRGRTTSAGASLDTWRAELSALQSKRTQLQQAMTSL
jgi:hypothetical protein